ncbi:MAG: cation:proton antiporter [Candidatus Nanopelagicales bacterium]|jgi:monovalent cation:H+ antiporter-2, CPA2 family|nr:cation:proton antiporter [Candidatus Nanopelagicales bacterium]MDP5050369.1 cation:proton antiporter [Candidatus Nanopelagicales bacterium]
MNLPLAASIIVDTAPLILDFGVVLLAAATLGYFARKLGLPAIVGYLLTGLAVSPFTPGYTADSGQLSLLAEIGVVLLLFEVGIEINLPKLGREQSALLWGSPLQLLIGMLIGTPIFIFLNVPIFGALLLALAIAMSSSVVIVNITRSGRRTTDVETEEALLAWSVLQDIVGVAIASLILVFFGNDDRSLPLALGGLIGFGIIAYVSARLLPSLLSRMRTTPDLFLIYSVAIGLVLAALGAIVFGIPMALAAFVAGLAIQSGEDSDEVRRVLLPFRDLFAVLFFVLIGSLIQPSQVLAAIPFALMLLLLMIALKTFPTYLIIKFSKIKSRALQHSIGLSQMGEFSFVLGAAGLSAKAISPDQFTAILLAVLLSIVGSSILVRISMVQPK